MVRRLIFSVLLLSLSTIVNAEQLLKQGVLQAYWLPVWNDTSTVNTPELHYRYFVLSANHHAEKIVNLDKQNSEALLTRYFSPVPENFLKFKEGHLERTGTAVINHLSSNTECDHQYYSGQLSKFTVGTQQHFDINVLENAAGCEARPYRLLYTLKSGITDAYFKRDPDVSAKNGVMITADMAIVTLERVNQQWIKAAQYDANQPDSVGKKQGFILLGQLQPLN
ncbi:hypothetical protein ABC733_11190 [Mangrovibacter sp. SLW1]